MKRAALFATFTSGIAVGFTSMLGLLLAYERSMFETSAQEALASLRRGR